MKTSFRVVLSATVFLAVFSWAGTAMATPICGNGIRQGAEECDDGNSVDGDGCSASCRDEKPSAPPVESTLELTAVVELGYHREPDYQIEEFSDVSVVAHVPLEYCGDGKHQPHLGEQCDDGNEVESDGCNSFCQKTFVRIQRYSFPVWESFR